MRVLLDENLDHRLRNVFLSPISHGLRSRNCARIWRARSVKSTARLDWIPGEHPPTTLGEQSAFLSHSPFR